jgi:hypothetical protein
MKLLLDFFPIILFFVAFKVAGIYVATAVAINYATVTRVGTTSVVEVGGVPYLVVEFDVAFEMNGVAVPEPTDLYLLQLTYRAEDNWRVAWSEEKHFAGFTFSVFDAAGAATAGVSAAAAPARPPAAAAGAAPGAQSRRDAGAGLVSGEAGMHRERGTGAHPGVRSCARPRGARGAQPRQRRRHARRGDTSRSGGGRGGSGG